MKIEKQPLLFYPGMVMFIDDDQEFLDCISLSLAGRERYKFQTDPKQAVRNLKHSHLDTELLLNFVSSNESTENDDSNLSVNFEKLQDMHSDPQKHNQYHVVVADYTMPTMNGIELFREIADLPVQKVLLTGEGDHQLAVDAFNEGIIDYFMLKQTSGGMDTLKKILARRQEEYFINLSQPIFYWLKERKSIIFSAGYQGLLQNIKEDINPDEFYLLNKDGCFKFIKDEKVFLLIIQSALEMNNYFEVAIDNGCKRSEFEALSKHKKLIWFISKEDFNLPVDDWSTRMHDATPVPNLPEHYYALIPSKF